PRTTRLPIPSLVPFGAAADRALAHWHRSRTCHRITQASCAHHSPSTAQLARPLVLVHCLTPLVVTSFATVGRSGALLVAFWVVAPTALAQITFSAPVECGSEQEFLTEVRALQRTDAESMRVTSVTISERAAGGYELSLEAPEGERVLTDADCRTLFRSAVVIAAAAGGPASAPATSEAPPATEASLAPVQTAPVAAPP